MGGDGGGMRVSLGVGGVVGGRVWVCSGVTSSVTHRFGCGTGKLGRLRYLDALGQLCNFWYVGLVWVCHGDGGGLGWVGMGLGRHNEVRPHCFDSSRTGASDDQSQYPMLED